jgi:DNA repair protein RecO (recombination protein O)
MLIHEAEAVVLRQYSLSEADRIIVLFTREFGLLRAVAKGSKRPQNRLAAALEPLTLLRMEFYLREGQSLAQLRQAEILHAYLSRTPTLERMLTYHYFAELVQELVQDNNANLSIYRLLLASLNAGEKSGICEALVRYFEFWCLKLSGLIPNYDYCSNCAKYVKDDGFFARLDTGQVRCELCADSRGLRICGESAVALQSIAHLPPEKFVAQPLSDIAAIELERLMQRLLELHLEKPLKSYPLLRQALRGERS